VIGVIEMKIKSWFRKYPQAKDKRAAWLSTSQQSKFASKLNLFKNRWI
jgi:hypothetical protein